MKLAYLSTNSLLIIDTGGLCGKFSVFGFQISRRRRLHGLRPGKRSAARVVQKCPMLAVVELGCSILPVPSPRAGVQQACACALPSSKSARPFPLLFTLASARQQDNAVLRPALLGSSSGDNIAVMLHLSHEATRP